jgi:uncharacterized protein (TIGR03083 family)
VNLPLEAVNQAVPREWTAFRALLSSADDAAWSAPTRLAGWAVRDLAVHAVWAASMEADSLRRRRTAAAGRGQGVEVGVGAGADEILAALDTSCDQLAGEVARLEEEDLPSIVPLPYGDLPVATFSQILAMEAGIHADDLAAALGRSRGLAGDVAVATDAFVRTFLPIVAATAAEAPDPGVAVALRGPTVDLAFVYRNGRWEVPEPEEPLTPTVTVEADDSTVLLFAMGRVPHSDARLRLSGQSALAGRIKAWLPGP